MTAREPDRMLAGLLRDSHLMRLEQLPDRVAERATAAGLHDVLIYLSDLQNCVLRLLTGRGPDADATVDGESAEEQVEGTLAGRAFQHGELLHIQTDGDFGHRWWVPLIDGTERLGVLRLDTAEDDRGTRVAMESLSALVSLILASKRGHSDSYARLVRTEPMNVAAEMQWHLMPPRTYADDRVVIGAAMEPAYEVGGDAFDYATTEDVVHLSMFDAMGHDTAAGLTANLAVAACRNHRRQGAGLVETGKEVEKVLVQHFGRSRYATGIMADLDTRTGMLTWINHGHPQPVIIRGGRWTAQLRCPPGHPLGSDLGLEATLCTEQLEPGDRVVLYTDGITEARNQYGEEFGLDRFTDFLIRRHADELPVPETLRRLVHSIMEYHHGRLRDDATVLVLEWHGSDPHGEERAAALAGLPLS